MIVLIKDNNGEFIEGYVVTTSLGEFTTVEDEDGNEYQGKVVAILPRCADTT